MGNAADLRRQIVMSLRFGKSILEAVDLEAEGFTRLHVVSTYTKCMNDIKAVVDATTLDVREISRKKKVILPAW